MNELVVPTDPIAEPPSGGDAKLDEILSKLTKFEEMAAAPPPEPEPDPEPEPPADPTYGYDPVKIVQASQSAAQAATRDIYTSMRQAETELDTEFGDSLTKAQKDSILNELSQVPHDQLKLLVTKRKAHLEMGNAIFGKAVRTGQVKPGAAAAPAAPATPIGAEAPSGGKTTELIGEFEKYFGPIKNKEQRKRIESAAGGY